MAGTQSNQGRRTLRVLIVEDSPADAELLKRQLTKVGYDVSAVRVESPAEFSQALATGEWDVIVADYAVPNFGAVPALKLLKQSGHDIPFIIMSGAISEEVAVASMRAGAHDFVLKNKLARLVPAIEREIQEAVTRRQKCQAEAALQEADEAIHVGETRLQGIIGSAMDAIISVDEQQRIVVFNHAAEKMFICPAPQAVGSPLDRFIPARFRDVHRDHIRRFGAAGATTRSMFSPGVLTALRSDGEEFPIEAAISQIKAAGQKLYTVILRDITERRRTEEALRQSEERFRSIYENAAVGIKQVAINGRLLMVNPAFCRMLGYSEAELLGKTFRDITYPEDLGTEAALLESMLRGEREFWELEKRYVHRNGSSVWVSVTSSLVKDVAGHPLYRVSIIVDISEKKRAEALDEQLERARKLEAIGQLAGGIAHDFNTLLNVMLGYSELLKAECPTSDPRHERLEQIETAAQMGAALTKQLLAFGRKQAVVPQVIDLSKAVASFEPMLRRLLPEDIELEAKYSVETCPVKVDPGQIQQILLNLATNARDAMPRGGNLTIEVRSVELDEAYVQHHPLITPGRHQMLAVSDTGMGMDADTSAHIFEPFFTTKEPGKGTGLGLATVYGIVKQSGGDVFVYSEPGVGSIFKIYFPRSSEAITTPEASRPAPQNLTGNETILLVEDSKALRQLTREILSQHGYAVLEASQGFEALEVFEKHGRKVHLLMTDIVMPKMRGTELAARVNELHSDIPVIYLSGYTEEAISHFRGQGRIRILEKPYTSEMLLRTVRQSLDDAQVTA
jgi:two-component system, cell cycle sensor histidine kinase and response regulator CckA